MAGVKIFVGSLPNDITDGALRLEFSKYGDVEEVYVKLGCEPGRQWAMVKFVLPEQALAAKEACDRVLTFPGSARPCDVMLAKNQGSKAVGSPWGQGAAQQAGGYEAEAGGASVAGVARKIFVGSLPDGIETEALREEFSQYGTVEDVFVKPECETGRQWAFVTFAHPEEATAAAQASNGSLQFPGSFQPCEVTLARHQGMYGQDPIWAAAPAVRTPAQTGSFNLVPASGIQWAPRKIFVGSLPDGVAEAAVRAEFAKFGEITEIFLKPNCEPGRQWAFVTYASSEEARNAKERCDMILTFPGAERPCEVTMARHQGMFGQDSDAPAVPAARAPLPASPYGNVPLPAWPHGTPYSSPAGGADRPRKIFVGSLPDGISDKVLRAEFSKYGQIADLFLKDGQESGRNWAFVTYVTPEQAAYAKESTDRLLMFQGSERACEVTLARNQGKFGQAPLGSPGTARAAVASAGCCAQPPPPTTPPPAHLTAWRMYRTAAGLPYYHNAATGVTQWDAPPDLQVPGQTVPVYRGQIKAGGHQRYSPY